MTQLIKVCRGVHRCPEQVSDEMGRIAALLSACSSDAVVCGLSAARAQGFWLPDWPIGRLEVVVNIDQSDATLRPYHRRPEVRARRQQLRPSDVTTVDGIAMTSPAKTWTDLADRLLPHDLLAAGDSALRVGTSLYELAEAVERARGCRGVIRARRVLPMLDGRARSRPESLVRYALLDAGLPRPEVNVAIYDDHGQWLAEPDLSYDDVRLAIEYNGRDHADVNRMRRDITRSLDIEERGGWRVVVFGPTEVFRRPDRVAHWVRQLRADPRRRLNPWSTAQ